jgi:hypothetical protein
MPVVGSVRQILAESLSDRVAPNLPLIQHARVYFVNICLTGFATVGSDGEIANVSQVLQPGARLAASKSP